MYRAVVAANGQRVDVNQAFLATDNNVYLLRSVSSVAVSATRVAPQPPVLAHNEHPTRCTVLFPNGQFEFELQHVLAPVSVVKIAGILLLNKYKHEVTMTGR